MITKVPATIVLVTILAAFVFLFSGIENNALTVRRHELSSPRLPAAFDGLRLVLIADLQSKRFRASQRFLAAAVREEKPDLVFMAGDMVDASRYDQQPVEELVNRLAGLRVYFVTGNHEWWSRRYNRPSGGLRGLLMQNGVEPLENRRVNIERGRSQLTLIGLDDPARYPGPLQEERFLSELRELSDPENSPFTILLVHRPEYFREYAGIGTDLILAGHAHGGQFRLPGFDLGFFSPGQGFFPDYTTGPYHEGRSVMIVSRGLGNSVIPLRLHNPPEIVSIILRRAEKID